jgi:DNA repair photolyase
MSVIYRPKGAALEYAPLALNLYTTCPTGCGYCYCPGCLHKTKEDFFMSARAKNDILTRIEENARKISGCKDEILLSFIGDVYPKSFESNKDIITRKVLLILEENNLNVTVLTKGGTRAWVDFDILKRNNWSFGSTLVFNNQEDINMWEPGAASYQDRKSAIQKAHALGIRTWVSCEPVINPVQTYEIIKETMPYVDHFKIGHWNHDKRAHSIDWKAFKQDIENLLSGRSYYLKHALLEAAK